MKRIITKLYNNKFISSLFYTSVSCLCHELQGCESVLDLGCGSNSAIQFCNIPYSVGVESYKPDLQTSKRNHIHSEYIHADIRKVKIPPQKFDAIIMMDVIEHLEKKEGVKLLNNIEKLARKKIIVKTPNGFLPSNDSKNPYQSHRSGWEISEMKKRGYKAYGMAGWKFLRKDEAPENIHNESFITMRFEPRSFWFAVSAFTQPLVYRLPKYAFEVMFVKEKNKTSK